VTAEAIKQSGQEACTLWKGLTVLINDDKLLRSKTVFLVLSSLGIFAGMLCLRSIKKESIDIIKSDNRN